MDLFFSRLRGLGLHNLTYRLEKPEKIFHGLAKANICIYDFNGTEILERCLRGITHSTIYTRNEQLHLNPLTLFWWLIYSFQHTSVMVAYFRALIKQIKPKVVLTFIDNDSRFYDLAKAFPRLHFIAVQNGWRYPYPIPTHAPARKSRAVYLGIGQNDLDSNTDVGLHFKHQIAIGSLKASLVADSKGPALYTICFPVSSSPKEWTRFNTLNDEELEVLGQQLQQLIDQLSLGAGEIDNTSSQSLEILTTWHALNDWMLLAILNRFIELNPSKSVCVAMRPGSIKADLAALSSIKLSFPDLLFVRATSWKSTYLRMQNSELVVGTGSTTCLEALYMGIKMLLIQSWAAKTHSPKLLPTWWLQNAKPDNVLSAIQDSVLIPKETFFSKNKDTIKYYSNYPPKKPAFVVVRDLVLSSLQE